MARPSRPDDLLTLRQASGLVGRSIDTLRRWRREHGLRDYRDPADPSAPSLLSRAEVVDLAARLAADRPDLRGIVDAVAFSSDDPLAAAITPASQAPVRLPGSASLAIPSAPSTFALVADLAADLRVERDRLRAERDRLRAEVEAARAETDRVWGELRAAAVRVATLETLVADGRRSALDAERERLRPKPPTPPKPKKRRK
jgi:hypothetical protein